LRKGYPVFVLKIMKKTLFFIRDSLSSYYDKNEIEGLIIVLFNTLFGYSRVDIINNHHITLTETEKDRISNIVNRLKNFEPIQYILGETEFYGLKLKVRPGVLIPRGETEELVQQIISDKFFSSPTILDIGTGSGCIAIALKINLPTANVVAFDVSEEALEVARENAALNQVEVSFFQYDILKPHSFVEENTWNIIVSNPPYITNNEKKLMANNVLEHEPHLALFVPDSDPLLFYRAIANFGRTHLTDNGLIYFEINEAFGRETSQLLADHGYTNIKLIKDIHGKDRMISARKELTA
jgi:release factor glutamine methyltransferase